MENFVLQKIIYGLVKFNFDAIDEWMEELTLTKGIIGDASL